MEKFLTPIKQSVIYYTAKFYYIVLKTREPDEHDTIATVANLVERHGWLKKDKFCYFLSSEYCSVNESDN